MSGLYLSLGFLIMGAGLQTVLVSLLGRQAGFSVQTIGWIGSFYFLGYLVGSRSVVQLIMGVAHIRTFSGLAALSTVSALSYLLWVDPIFWAFLRFVSGFCLAGLYVVVESWVNNMAKPGGRGRAISRYRQVDLTASVVAQGLLFLAPFDGTLLFPLLCIFLAFSIVPLSMLRISQPTLESAEKMGFKEAFRLTPFALLGCFIIGMINSMIWALGPLFISAASDGNESSVALFLMMFLLAGALGEGPMGRLSDRFDRRVFILVCSGVSAAGALYLGWFGFSGDVHLFVGAVVFGLFWVPIYSMCIALAHDQSKVQQFLSMSSSILLAYSTGAFLGPSLGGMAMGIWGEETLFLLISISLFVIVLFGFYRMIVRKPVAPKDMAEFVVVPVESGDLIFELDPRVDEKDHVGDSSKKSEK